MAIHFNGSSQGIQFEADTAIQGPFTVSAWVAPTAVKDQKILQQGDSNTNPFGQWGIMLRSWGIQLFIIDASVGTQSCESFDPYPHSDGTWWHIAGTYSGSQLKLYVEGVLVQTLGTIGSIANTDTHVTTIGYSQIFNYFFEGAIAEAAIWNSALDATQIASLATSGTKPSDVGSPVGYWPMRGEASPALDLAGTNDGVFVGGPRWAPHPWTTGQIDLVGDPVYASSSSSVSSLPITKNGVTAGNALVVFSISYQAAVTAATDKGDTPEEASFGPVTGASGEKVQAHVFNNCVGGNTQVTITPSSSSYLSIIVLEVTGQVSASVINANDGDSAFSPIEVGPITTDAKCLLLAFIGQAAGGQGYTPADPWVEVLDAKPSDFQGFQAQRLGPVAAGSYTATWSAGPSLTYAGYVIALEASETVTTITMPSGSVPVTGFAPTIMPGSVTITLPAGSVPVSGHAPTVTAGSVTLTLPAGSVPIAGHAPTVTPGAVTLTLPIGSVPVTGHPPNVLPDDTTIAMPLGNVPVTGYAPTVTPGDVTIAMPNGVVTITGFPPTIQSGDVAITMPLGSVPVSGHAPSILPGDVILTLPIGSVSIVGYPPTIVFSPDQIISMPIGVLMVSGYPPRVGDEPIPANPAKTFVVLDSQSRTFVVED
jgi:hypothetical protein